MLTRRHLLTALAASPFATTAWGKDLIDLQWADLIPEGTDGTLMQTLRGMGVVQHDQLSTGFEQPEAGGVTEEYNGKTVRIPGFVVPLDFESIGVTTFILAPFLGACIHVPPPPANQLILVDSEEPYEIQGLYDAVYVTGTFTTLATSTELAEIGYSLTADEIVPYS